MPNSGLDAMIDLDKFDDLKRLYQLFSMVPEGLPCLRKSLKGSVGRRGAEISGRSSNIQLGDGENEDDAESEKGKGKEKGQEKGKARPPNPNAQSLAIALKWVQDVLHLKDRFDYIWKNSFDSNRDLESGLNEVGEPTSFPRLSTNANSRPLNHLLMPNLARRSSYRCSLTRT